MYYANKWVGFFPGHDSFAYFFFLGSSSSTNISWETLQDGNKLGVAVSVMAGFSTGGAIQKKKTTRNN